jgi:putative DNA primase/helicase
MGEGSTSSPAKATKLALGDATHYELAMQWAMHNSAMCGVGGHSPVFNGGAFYRPDVSQLWQMMPIGKVEAQVAALFQGERLCRKAADYRGVAATAINLCDNPEFFGGAPIGVATPAGFHRIGPGGAVVTEPLSLEHRQTFALHWVPDAEVEPILLDRLLADALDGPDAAEQIELVWQIIGACLFGLLPRLQVCVFFIGRERSGKSTLQQVLARLFPPEAVSAVPPSNWGREYFVASLAGKRINLVGELDDAEPIPAAAFKNITGGGLVEGRHPTHRPFFFVPSASHVFAANTTPATTDKSEGFFRRCCMVHFRHRVPDDAVDPDLVDKIVAHEMPGVLARAFAAAESVARAGRLRTTPSHLALVEKWRHAANPLMQWLADEDAVELDPAASEVPTTQAYAHYRRWAANTGFRHAFGRNHCLELLEVTGPARGVFIRRRVVHGLRLIEADR